MTSADHRVDEGFRPDTYGKGFADVYDRWYPSDDSTARAVEAIAAFAGPRGRVLELGVGTGRLAIPLAEAGLSVTGLDSSEEMISQIHMKAPGSTVKAHLIDLGDEDAEWPGAPADVVVAAFNLVCNIIDPAQQALLFRRCGEVLRPGGNLIVETFIADTIRSRELHLEVREVTQDSVVLIASETDPDRMVVTGQHIELRDGEPVRLRPWQLRVTDPDELDRWAARAGLTLDAQWSDWTSTPLESDPGATTRIAIYGKPTA